MAAKLIRVTHEIAIQLHLVAQSRAICSSRSRQPSGNFWIHHLRLIFCSGNQMKRVNIPSLSEMLS